MEDFSRTIDLGAANGTVFYLRGLAYQELGQDRRDPDLAEKPLGSGSPATTGQR